MPLAPPSAAPSHPPHPPPPGGNGAGGGGGTGGPTYAPFPPPNMGGYTPFGMSYFRPPHMMPGSGPTPHTFGPLPPAPPHPAPGTYQVTGSAPPHPLPSSSQQQQQQGQSSKEYLWTYVLSVGGCVQPGDVVV